MIVSVRELKNGLSKYLRRAQAGEEILVTSHGKSVGRLLGPRHRQVDSRIEALVRLEAQSWLRANNGKKILGADHPAHVSDGTNDELLRWVRGE